MLAADCHVHSGFSSDADTPVEQMIEAAIAQGRRYFYLTDHHDIDYPVGEDERDFILDMESYLATLEQLRNKYQPKIEIRTGMELGLQAQIADKVNAFAAKYPVDFVIGSSHLVHGQDPYYAEYYEGKTEQQAYEQYFLSILENAQAFDCFQVYGHLDYIVRYGHGGAASYHCSDYVDIIDEILRTAIEKGIGIELNTSGLRQEAKETLPSLAILRLYRSLGGEIITLGSDAHTPDFAGCAIREGQALLKACGFGRFCTFDGGAPVWHEL